MDTVLYIIISAFAVYGFLILLHDIKTWCIDSATKEKKPKGRRKSTKKVK